MITEIRRTSVFLFFSILCLWCAACDDSGLSPHEAEREKRLLSLLEIHPESAKDSAVCEAIYALDSPDRYIYRRISDDPPGTPRFEYDIAQTILDSMSTRGLLETGLGHPKNAELAPLTVCSSIWRCRESMFSFLMNVWSAFEKRPDALEECLKRYDKLSVSCEPLTRNVKPVLGGRIIFYVQMQITLIEIILTRPAFLNQLSPKVQRKLAAKVLAKLRQADMFYSSELGKTQGLWLLSALMLHAKDSAFTELIRQDQEVELLSRGLVLGHNLRMKATVITHAERFAAGK